jgi:hypothetical protein
MRPNAIVSIPQTRTDEQLRRAESLRISFAPGKSKLQMCFTESDLYMVRKKNFGTATQHHTTRQSGPYLNNHVVFQRETTRALS